MTNEDRNNSPVDLARLERNFAPPVKAILHIDGKGAYEIVRRVILGREPVGGDEIDTITLTGDPIMSRSHLAFDVSPDGIVVLDLGSKNGTRITIGGVTRNVPTDVWTPVDSSAVVHAGDTPIRVEYRESFHPERIPATKVVPESTGCISCGQKLAASAHFCDRCGASVTEEVVRPPSSAAVSTSQFATVVRTPPASPARPSTARASGRKFRTGPKRRSGGVRSLSKNRHIGAVASVVVVVLCGWAVFAKGNSDGDSSASRSKRVPLGNEERWSVDIDGAVSVVGSASVLFVLAIEDGDAEIISLAGDSGEERWSVDIGRNVSYGNLPGIVNGVVLAKVCDVDGACDLLAVGTSSGEELWSQRSFEGNVFVSDSGSLMTRESRSLSLLDPRDGKRIERVRGDFFGFDRNHVYVRDSDEIEVFDSRDLSSVFGPVEVDEGTTDFIYQNGKLITAVDDELVVINSDGTVDRESRVPAGVIYRVLAGPSGMVIVGTDEGVFGLDPVDGRAEEIWSANGSLSFGFVSSDGPLVFIEDGEDAEVLDSRTGDTRIDLRNYIGSDLLVGFNGLIHGVLDGDQREATAFRYSDGEEIWSDDLNGAVVLVDNGVIEIDDGEVRLLR